MAEPGWAVYPRIDDHRPSDVHETPKVFESEQKASRFLNSRVPWPPERFAARQEALQKLKRGEISRFNFPQHLIRRKNRDYDWEGPVPIIPAPVGSRSCNRSFRSFLPLEALGRVPGESLESILVRVFENRFPRPMSFLAEDWRFGEIEKDSWQRVGHEFEGRNHTSIAAIVLGGVYDLESSLRRCHPGISCDSVADFFSSWQTWKHVAEFSTQVGKSKPASLIAGDSWKAGREAENARDFLYVQLAVFAHEIVAAPKPQAASTPLGDLERSKSSRAALDNQAYLVTKEIEGNANYEVPRQLWLAVKLVLDDLPADVTGPHELSFHHRPNILLAQIQAVRARVQHRIDVLEPLNAVSAVQPMQTTMKRETIGEQIDRLRIESRLSLEDVAAAIDRDPTTVSRNISGKLTAHPRTLAAYERVFSKALKRQVVINKTP